MTLQVDASSPAAVVGSGSLTSASFSPPANSFLVVRVYADNNDGSTETCTVTATGGVSPTLKKRHNRDDTGVGALVEVWGAPIVSAPGSITIGLTDDQTPISGSARRMFARVYTDSNGAIPAGLGAVTAAAADSVAYTSTVADSLGLGHGIAGGGTPTAGSGQTRDDFDTSFNGGDGCWSVTQNATTPTPGTTVTMSVTPGSGTSIHAIAVELLPGVPATPGSPGQKLPAHLLIRLAARNRAQWYGNSGGTTYTQSLAGTITPSGALTKQTAKPLAGTVAPSGALAKQAQKPLAGAVTPSGALTRQANKALAGTATPAGALAKLAAKGLAGSTTPTGSLGRQCAKALAGVITPAGGLAKLVAKAFAGSATPSGTLALIKVLLRSYGGTITPTGSLTRQANKALSGTVTPAGLLTKAVTKALAGAVAPIGALAKLVRKLFGGSTTPTGTLTATIPTAAANATSDPTVTAHRASTPDATARRTSTPGVSGRRTSNPSVSDG